MLKLVKLIKRMSFTTLYDVSASLSLFGSPKLRMYILSGRYTPTKLLYKD